MASPSRPSVRFTALPAPTMTKAPKTMKNQPRLMTESLKNGKASEVANGGRPSCDEGVTGAERRSALRPGCACAPEKPVWLWRVTFR